MSADLREAQQLLAGLISAVDSVERTLDAEQGAGGRASALDALLRSDARLSAVRRLEVYAHAYFFRLHDALAEDFGALAGALGSEYFHDLITAYLQAYPSNTPSVRFVGAHLAHFVAAHPDGAWVRQRFPFAASLAELEWAFLAAFDAPDATAARRDELGGIAPEDFGRLQLRLAPALLLLDLGHHVLALREAHDRGDTVDGGAASAQRQRVLVWRRDERVSYRPLDALEHRALHAARAGATFGELCALAADELGIDAGPAQAARWLGRWIEDECVTSPPVLADLGDDDDLP